MEQNQGQGHVYSNYQVMETAVSKVFNSWTALRLAVDQGMASTQSVLEMVTYVSQFCTKPNIDVYDLMNLLEDIMDDRFNTLCEDDSPAEVAQVLINLVQIYRMNDLNLLQNEIAKLPECKLWLCRPEVRHVVPIQPHEVVHDDDDEQSDVNNQEDEPMEEDPDPGWTVVKTRRK